MRKVILFVLLFIILTGLTGFVSPVSAITIEGGDIRLGINGYISGLYIYMGKMPMAMGGQMPDASTFENDTHLLFNAVKERLRVNVNVHWDNSVLSNSSETVGEFGITETFGEYAFSEQIQLKAGYFLTPFGIYNEISYVTPLFSSVVLPMMYEPPQNYSGEPLVPENANVMFFGKYSAAAAIIDYYFYGGNGELAPEGVDKNKDKGFGGRIKIELPYGPKIGGSYYSHRDHPTTEGRENLLGTDIDITVRDLRIEAEYAIDRAEKAKDRFAYYTRLTYHISKFAPFIGYDYFKDKGDMLFDRGLNRYSIGTSYTANNYVTLKAEYHYHQIDDTKGLMADQPEDIQMFLGAAIFIF